MNCVVQVMLLSTGNNFSPTPEDRRLVELAIASRGRPHQLCVLFKEEETGDPISLPDFEQVFKNEILCGTIKVDLAIITNLVRIATARENTGPVYQAAKFWLTSRAGWSDSYGTANPTQRGPVIEGALAQLKGKLDRFTERASENVVSLNTKSR